MRKNTIKEIIIRYLVLLILVLIGLRAIYTLLTPLTINFSSLLLKTIYNIEVSDTIILINSSTKIRIIPACVAGSAYLLLLILNLITPMKINTRIKSVLFSFIILFIINVFRIFIMAVLYHNNFAYVNFTHKALWYALSTIFVIVIWFTTIKIYKIKKIPIYSDCKELMNNKI